MAGRVTDIVVTTRNRLGYLWQTVEHILARTCSSYALHVIDDASEEENVKYLLDLWRRGKIHTLVLRGERCGAKANLNVGTWLAFSDPVVFTDDDVLCPDVEPDWLAQGLRAVKDRPQFGIVALNHPGAQRHKQESDGVVTPCRNVGGTFMFVRRELLRGWSLSHRRGNFSLTPTMERCQRARDLGMAVGYLTNVYCHHIGAVSAHRDGEPYKGRMIEPLDFKTLTPSDRWAG